MDDVKACDSRAKLVALLDETLGAQNSSRLESTKLFPDTPESRMESLVDARYKLATALSDAAELGSISEQASYTAQSVSSRVNEALALYERAADARMFVDTTLELRNSIQAMSDAMDVRDWERAALAAHTALNIPNSIKESELALRMVPSSELPEAPEVSLRQGCEAMAALFCREFDKACEARDTAALTRWFKLLPQVGHEKAGLVRYSKFISGIIATQSRSLIAGANSDNPSFYGIAITRLFESIAAILAQHSALVERYYGGKAMPHVIDVIQREVDAQGGLILDTWLDERRIENLHDDIKAYSFPGLVAHLAPGSSRATTPMKTESGMAGSYIDLEEVTQRIAELDLMLNRWRLYQDFISRWPEAVKHVETSGLAAKFKSSVEPTFESLAIFVFRRTVETALDADKVPPATSTHSPDNPLVSSVVDDVTYMFSTLMEQAVGTANSDLENSILSDLLRVLQADYATILGSKITAHMSDRFLTFVYLNDLEVTADYVDKVVDRAKEINAENDHSKLHDISAKFRKRAHAIVTEGTRAWYNSSLSGAIRSLCGRIFRGTYLLSPNEPESTRGIEFSEQWRKLVAPIESLLHPSIYNYLMTLAAQSVARLVEKWIWSLEGQVNELGAIALDRDVSKIISTLSISRYELRENFLKVARIVTLIEMESPEDTEEDETILTKQEIELAMRIRV